MKKERLHTTSLILGSILALAITFSQYLTPDCISGDGKAKTEQTDTSGKEKGPSIELPTFSIPAPVTVQGGLDAYFLFEILLEEDVDENYVEEEESYVDRFLQTMFRVIISPNAP
jgi:hypothetical protein